MKTTTSIGQQAEQAATDYLTAQGFKILQRNWRTRWCEIDIVASKDGVVYFVEVKYRRGSAQGTGLNYITSTKLRQMRFAAEMWLANQDFSDDAELAALAVEGSDFAVVDFVVGLD